MEIGLSSCRLYYFYSYFSMCLTLNKILKIYYSFLTWININPKDHWNFIVSTIYLSAIKCWILTIFLNKSEITFNLIKSCIIKHVFLCRSRSATNSLLAIKCWILTIFLNKSEITFNLIKSCIIKW